MCDLLLFRVRMVVPRKYFFCRDVYTKTESAEKFSTDIWKFHFYSLVAFCACRAAAVGSHNSQVFVDRPTALLSSYPYSLQELYV